MAFKEDINGYLEFEDVPLIKVGVFPYSGAQIRLEDGSYPFDENEIVNVYRSAEELSKEECIESFKRKPLFNDHTMVGFKDGLTLPDDVQIEGVSADKPYFDGEYIRNGITGYTKKFKDLIDSGKRQLSAGYRCIYVLSSGVFNGIPYQVRQKNIKLNHEAIVDVGRNGSDVAISLDCLDFALDSKSGKVKNKIAVWDYVNFSCDSITGLEKKMLNDKEEQKQEEVVEVKILAEENEGEKTGDTEINTSKTIEEKLDKAIDLLLKIVSMEKQEATLDADEIVVKDEDMKEEEKKMEKAEKEISKDTSEEMTKSKDSGAYKAMDSAELKNLVDKQVGEAIMKSKQDFTKKESFAKRLEQHIGYFATDSMSFSDVLSKGIKELKIKNVPKGGEEIALDAYLQAMPARSLESAATAMDSAISNKYQTEIDSLFGGK